MTNLNHKDITSSFLQTGRITKFYTRLDISNSGKINHYEAIKVVSKMRDGESTAAIHQRITTTWNFCSGVSHERLEELLNNGITLDRILTEHNIQQ